MSLPIASPPLPETREDCGQLERPCPNVHCRHNLAPEDERRGRPHGGRPAPTRVRVRSESCALDITDEYPEGLDRQSVAELLGLETAERIRQIEQRALLKVRVGKVLLDAVDDLRGKLPEGTRLHLAYERSSHSGMMAVTLVFSATTDGQARSATGSSNRTDHATFKPSR